MDYVFGPVPSRRLGRSLGIDPVPLKTCNWNCIYCQLGRSTPVVHERKEYLPREDILDEVRRTLQKLETHEIDWITFVGSGETTLHTGLGWLIRNVKNLTDKPVAVITNGSLFSEPDVRRDLLPADAVLPSLDAGSEALYRRMNRPHPTLSFQRHLEGLISFAREYRGKLWVEVMLVRDVNDTQEALEGLKAALARIGPDEVHVVVPTRPAVEPWVKAPDDEGLMRATAVLEEIAKVVPPAEGEFDLSGGESIVDAIVAILQRHPVSEAQLERSLARRAPDEGEQALAELRADPRAALVSRNGVSFWTAAEASFPA
ncbi:MAG: radical SAM protein [Planctomycetota bacterium]|nr:radical SAM protein [Planctomycetota bacterium]